MNENQELLEDIVSTVLAAFYAVCKVDPKTVKFEDSPEILSGKNIFKLGNTIILIHQDLEVLVDYEPLSEFELFPTVASIVEYMYNKKIN